MNPPWANPWQSYYNPGPDPNAYNTPPQFSAAQFYGGYRPDPPPRFHSVKYPELCALLASDTTRLQFDVRRPPQEMNASTFLPNRHAWAQQNGTKKVRIISKAFPWTLDIEHTASPVSCEDIWVGLHRMLQDPIADSEWALILNIKKHREVVEAAARKRRDADTKDEVRLRRIDYLGDKSMFNGLDKDPDYEKLRLLQGVAACPDTWVVSFRGQ